MSTREPTHAELAADAIARVTDADAMLPTRRILTGDKGGRTDTLLLAIAEASLAQAEATERVADALESISRFGAGQSR